MDQWKMDVNYIDELVEAMDGICQETVSIAVVGKKSPHWAEAMAAAGSKADVVVPLPEDQPLHRYKRLLNEYQCGCLMYSQEYEELAYRIQNDGVTLVHCYIPID